MGKRERNRERITQEEYTHRDAKGTYFDCII